MNKVAPLDKKLNSLIPNNVDQGGTCGPREHLIWPASEFSLPNLNLEHKIASKQSSMTSRYLDSMSTESLNPQMKVEYFD